MSSRLIKTFLALLAFGFFLPHLVGAQDDLTSSNETVDLELDGMGRQ